MGSRLTKTEFIFEDSEIPDLVLETIIGFVVEMTPMEKWGEIRSVSKRWNRVSKPVIKEAFAKRWPRFILPRKRKLAVKDGKEMESLLELKSPSSLKIGEWGEVTIRKEDEGYSWMFVSPLSLKQVVAAGKPVGVSIMPNEDGGGLYLGVWIVHGMESNLFEVEMLWDPEYRWEELHLDGEASMCALGCYSGETIGHNFAEPPLSEPEDHTAITESRALYTVEYRPGGDVVFKVNGEQRGKTKLQESQMLEHHVETAVLAFAVSLDNKSVVKLFPKDHRPAVSSPTPATR